MPPSPTAPPTKTYSREEILGALTQLERMSDAEIAAIADAHDEPFPDEPFPDDRSLTSRSLTNRSAPRRSETKSLSTARRAV